MAISKQFIAHTELKAEDLNELISQTNDFIVQEGNKKPDIIDIINYLSEGAILPDSSYYVHAGRPVLSTSGEYYDTRWIGFCMSHFNSLNHSIALYTRNENDRYVFYSQFRADEANTSLEQHVALVFGGLPATPTTPGLMSAADKNMFDDMVTEVFPLTVAVASSNAGTYEVGDAQHSVTPQIVLSITRKGADVSSSAQTTSSQGEVQPDHKTIIGSALTSGTTTFQISVSQGGQTVNAPNQVFDFMNYMYYGEVSTKPASATAVATLCQNGTLSKQLSRATTKTSTNLAANKYYVFAVKGSVNLVCRHAGTDAVVTGCTTETATIQRVNQSGSDSYSYIIVEKSASAWSFKITNS